MRQEFDFKDILHIYETDSKWSVSFRTYGEYDLAHGVSLIHLFGTSDTPCYIFEFFILNDCLKAE